MCHDDSHYAALYAYYDNNNDSDDIAWNDERLKTTPTLATVMNFIIAFSLSIPRPCLASRLFHARAHEHTHVRHTKETRGALRHCAVAVALTASVQLTRSFPFSVISEDGNGVTENRGGRRQQRGTSVVLSVNARNAADASPGYCDSNYYRYRVCNFNPFNKSRSRSTVGRERPDLGVQQLYAN